MIYSIEETAPSHDSRAAGGRLHPLVGRDSWQPIESLNLDDAGWLEVDLWLNIYASPRSMGMSDAFRVTNCYRKKGGWWHFHGREEKQLFDGYITHWMPVPAAPNAESSHAGPVTPGLG